MLSLNIFNDPQYDFFFFSFQFFITKGKEKCSVHFLTTHKPRSFSESGLCVCVCVFMSSPKRHSKGLLCDSNLLVIIIKMGE